MAWEQRRPTVLLKSSRAGARKFALFIATSALLLAAGRFFGPLLLRRALCIVFGLRPPEPGGIRWISELLIPGGSDGVRLSTSVFAREGGPAPTMLIRTPYGKHVLALIAYAVAAQGFNVVTQDTRGRFRSSGPQGYAAQEDVDGVATLDWLAGQGFPWYDPDRVVMFGISYLGVVQWALVAGLERRRRAEGVAGVGPRVRAIAPLFASSQVHNVFFRHNAFAFDFYIRYLHLMTSVNSLRDQLCLLYFYLLFELRLWYSKRRCLGTETLLKELGVPSLFKRCNPRKESRFWQERDYSDALPVAPPAFIATGWHDLFLEGALQDYEDVVRQHGQAHSRLLVGPWTHLQSLSPGPFRALARAAVDFLRERAGLGGGAPREAAPVRLWIMGARASQGCWRDFASWPPEEVKEKLLLLGSGSLGSNWQADSRACGSQESRLRYDPRDPTPSVGGCYFLPHQAGEKEQSWVNSRSDVLCFESPPLTAQTTVLGRARLRLYVRSSRPHFDVFAQLCDVHPGGRSFNVCDGVVRRRGPLSRARSAADVQQGLRGGGTGAKEAMGMGDSEQLEPRAVAVDVAFSATAKRIGTGHRLRLVVAGSAFPRFARHFGDTEQALEHEPLEVEPCTLAVLHVESWPSALWLPVLEDGPDPAPRRRSLAQASAERQRRPSRGHSEDLDARLRKTQSDAAMLQ